MRSRTSRLWTAILAITLGICLVAELAAAQTRPARQLQCMACHAGSNRLVFDAKTGQMRSVTINITDFHNADHGKTECQDCHTEGFHTFPHRNKKTETCMDCHPRTDAGAKADKPYEFDRIQKEYEQTVHFTEYRHAKERCCGTAKGKLAALDDSASDANPDKEQKAKQRFTCEHCHEPHYFKATRRNGDPVLILQNDNGPCLNCHKDDATGPLADPAKPTLLKAHSYLPYADLHLKGTRCIDCHTSVKTAVAHDLPVGKGADQGCNTCHSIDSVLSKRLYRYAQNTGSTLGFHNARILQDGYLMGGNRNRWTDIAAYLLVSFGLILTLAHGGWRLLAWWRPTETPAASEADNKQNETRRSGERRARHEGV